MQKDDLNALAFEKGMQANICIAQGNYESALKLTEEAEQIYRKLRDSDGIQKTLGYQAMVLINTGGDLHRAKGLLEEQKRICIDIGNEEGLKMCNATTLILNDRL